jgi:hypothetical protein
LLAQNHPASTLRAFAVHECSHREEVLRHWKQYPEGAIGYLRGVINLYPRQGDTPKSFREGAADWLKYAELVKSKAAKEQPAGERARVTLSMEIMAPTAANVEAWKEDPIVSVPMPFRGEYRSMLKQATIRTGLAPEKAEVAVAQLAYTSMGYDYFAGLVEHLRISLKPQPTVEQFAARLGKLLASRSDFSARFQKEFGQTFDDAVEGYRSFLEKTAETPEVRFRGTLFETYRNQVGPNMRVDTLKALMQ